MDFKDKIDNIVLEQQGKAIQDMLQESFCWNTQNQTCVPNVQSKCHKSKNAGNGHWWEWQGTSRAQKQQTRFPRIQSIYWRKPVWQGVPQTHARTARHTVMVKMNPPLKKQHPQLHVQERVLVNPCSYDAVATFLRNLGNKSGIRQYGGDREWLMVVCDGIPYNLCRRIMNSYHTCSKCAA